MNLGDVYAVIAYYLRHQEAVDEYVRWRHMEADEIERQIRAMFPGDGLRERLLARLQGPAERRERKSMEPITGIINGEPYQHYPLGEHIVRAIGVCGGRPTFKYTRIEIAGTLRRLATCGSLDALVEGYRGRVPRAASLGAIRLVTDQFIESLPELHPAT